jgi:hypothetical protein
LQERNIINQRKFQGGSNNYSTYLRLKTGLLNEIFKNLIKVLVPFEFKLYAGKILKNINNFDSFDSLHKVINENQEIIKDFCLIQNNSVMNRLYMFFENLDLLVLKYQDIINDVNSSDFELDATI